MATQQNLYPSSIPAFIWRMLFAALVTLAVGASPVHAEQFVFSPGGCQFSVIFPSTPTIAQVAVVGGAVDEAELAIDREVLRANCLPQSPEFLSDPDSLRQSILAFLVQNGFSGGTAQVKKVGYGLLARGRGQKKLLGVWATYDPRAQQVEQSRKTAMSCPVVPVTEGHRSTDKSYGPRITG